MVSIRNGVPSCCVVFRCVAVGWLAWCSGLWMITTFATSIHSFSVPLVEKFLTEVNEPLGFTDSAYVLSG